MPYQYLSFDLEEPFFISSHTDSPDERDGTKERIDKRKKERKKRKKKKRKKERKKERKNTDTRWKEGKKKETEKKIWRNTKPQRLR